MTAQKSQFGFQAPRKLTPIVGGSYIVHLFKQQLDTCPSVSFKRLRLCAFDRQQVRSLLFSFSSSRAGKSEHQWSCSWNPFTFSLRSQSFNVPAPEAGPPERIPDFLPWPLVPTLALGFPFPSVCSGWLFVRISNEQCLSAGFKTVLLKLAK